MTPYEELLRDNEELRAAIQARDEFLAIAAHELRNPMHALLLQIGVALQTARKLGDAELIHRLERVRHVVDRYVARATTLLDISRINTGGLQLCIQDVDACDVLRQVVDAHALEAQFHGASLTLTAPPHLRGRWDPLALEQILSNLVSNAIRYGNGQPAHVSAAREGDDVCFAVSDRGIGIAADDLQRIFGRFKRTPAAQAHGGGFGIGLWLARALIDAHHGSISVESTPGTGTTFTVRLPLDTPSAELDNHE